MSLAVKVTTSNSDEGEDPMNDVMFAARAGAALTLGGIVLLVGTIAVACGRGVENDRYSGEPVATVRAEMINKLESLPSENVRAAIVWYVVDLSPAFQTCIDESTTFAASMRCWSDPSMAPPIAPGLTTADVD